MRLNDILRKYEIPSHMRRDVVYMLSHICEMGEYAVYIDDIVITDAIENALTRLKNNEPVSKIINKKYFWKREFFVNEDVLDPRHDSETMIEAIISTGNISSYKNILDIGVGSGALLISVLDEVTHAFGVGIDISEKAISVANINARDLSHRCSMMCVDICDFVSDIKFDLVISNPPYIAFEEMDGLDDTVLRYDPHIALFAHDHGLSAYKAIANAVCSFTHENSDLYLEIGHTQRKDVEGIFAQKWSLQKVFQDIEHRDRVMWFRKR